MSLASEQKKAVRNQIADVIGDVAASILTNDGLPAILGLAADQIWPNLIQTVFELYQTAETKNKLSSLRIMKCLFYYASDSMMNYKDHILTVLNECMHSEDVDILVSACEALGSLITTLEPAQIKHFNALSPRLLLVAANLCRNPETDSQASDVMNVMADISETEPRYLKRHFNDLLDLMISIRNTQGIDGGLKDQAIEVIVTISERYPEFLKKTEGTLKKILEMIFSHMVEIEDEIGEDWANPKDGFNEDNEEEDDQKIIKFGMNCIDRLIAHVGSKIMLPQVSSCVQSLLAQDGWKYKNAALMALSQVGEYIEDTADIEPILQEIANHVNHENPRIRYACLHCLGQLSDDMAPELEEKYHQVIIPMFMSRVDDPVPRVLSHAFAGMTNFLEHCPQGEVLKILDPLYQKLIYHLQNGSSFVKENVLAALAALSEGAQEEFLKYYPATMDYMVEILRSFSKKEYKQIRGQSIECITIMSATMGKDSFRPYQDIVIAEMLKVQKNDISNDEDDPQKNYLLSGWQRILVIMGKDFSAYIDQIFPSLLDIVRQIVKDEGGMETGFGGGDDEEGDKNVGTTYQDDEAEIAIEMLLVFLTQLGEDLCHWFQQIWESIEPILNTYNCTVKTAACKVLPTLVKLLKNSELSANLPQFSRQLIARLWKGMDEENDSEVLIEQGRALQKVVEESGPIMTEEELWGFYRKCLKHLEDSDQRKTMTEKHRNDGDDDEPEIDQVIAEDKDKEDDLHVQIAEIIGSLFKSHGEKSLAIAKDLYDKFILQSLDKSMNDKMHKFGLFLICDIVDHLGPWLNPELINVTFPQKLKPLDLH